MQERGRAAVPLIRPGVSSISRVPENPPAFNGNELHSQQKSRHPRHISMKKIRIQCLITVKGSQTITRMFHSCRKPHLALSEPNTPHQAPASSHRTNIKAWATCINPSMLYTNPFSTQNEENVHCRTGTL